MEAWSVADVGAADGDLSFFLEKAGFPTIDLIDNPPPNWNGLRGATELRDALQSKVAIHHIDLDRQSRIPRDQYSLIVLLAFSIISRIRITCSSSSRASLRVAC